MNINVRVLSANARAQIAALQAQVRALEGQLATANATAAAPTGIAGARNRKSMMAWGNQIQWTGRQLQYNWTLPLLLAGGAATKFALDNEKAFTRVEKVYGDTEARLDYFRKNQDKIPEGMNATTAAAAAQENELKALGEAFEALSSRYGVAQKEVLETAGAWAAAGSSGADLARSTELSIKAAILGDMDLAKATESLIAIQAQYSLSTKQLGLTLSELNAIENQTGISMQGLIDGFSRSAGVAREAGVDVRHLGAMLAALVPATGSAATAGNALKTIISRLMSPTGDAAKVMKEFGVNTADAAWQSSTAVERLTILAGHMGDSLKKSADGGYELSDSQKQVVASVLGSRYQMNRFLVLMREMGPEQTYYEKALAATADRQKVFATSTKELNAVLDSSPQRLKIIWSTLQNGMADAIQPLIPYLLYLAQSVSNAVQTFGELDPAVQKLFLVMAVGLAILPMTIRYFGSLLTLVGAIGLPFKAAIGLWVRFATVTKIVNGVAVTTRRSLIGMVASLIAAPFAKIASGFGLIIGKIIALGAWFIRLPAIATASSAAMSGAGALAAAAWSAGIAGMVAAWRAVWTAMILVQSLGMATILRRWLVGLAFMARGASAFAGITAIFSGVFAAISVLFSRQMFMPLIMGMARLTTLMGYMWTAMWVSIRATMVTAQLALLSAMTTLRIALLTGWTGLYIAMVAVMGAAQRAIIAAWAAFQAGLSAVMVAGRAVMVGIWAAMHAAMALISRAFWIGVIRVWIAGALMLPRLLLGIRGALQTAWAVIIGLMRTGALRAALMAAGPWVAAGAAIIGVLYLFRDELGELWNNIIAYFSDSSNEMTQLVLRAWNALPQGVANALTAVANIVRDAALQIYEWFSYINPFAHHSPSLVENVTQGMAIVGQQFGMAAGAIKGHVMGAYRDIKAFGAAVKGIMGGAASFEQAQQRAKIKKFAPGALEEFDALARRLKTLQSDLAKTQAAMDKQQAVVDRWTAKLEKANRAIDRQQDKLDKLTAIQDKWQSKLDEAQDRLDHFASAPIKGMGAMSDKIFENEMAQKRLRLEMMKMEEAGDSLDDIKAKMEALNGAQEMLRGEQAGLRSAGAGSEILGQYDDQIAALEATRVQQNEAAEAIQNMSNQLAELERQGQMLDLENSLAFDPLTRQIEAAANAMEELPFDQIMAGVRGANVDIEKYQEKLDAATAAVDAQQAVVDKLTAARDRLQDRLDREQDKLDKVKAAYDAVNDAISQVNSTMSDAASAADTLAKKAEEAAKKAKDAAAVSPAVQNFRDAAGGNFANVGGAGIPIRTDWSDQSAEIDKFTQDIADQASAAFGDLNPFAPLKDKWKQFVGWAKGAWGQFSDAAGDMFDNIFSGGGGGGGLEFITGTIDKFKTAWATTSDWFKNNVIDPLVSVWRLFWPSIKEFLVNAWKGIKDMFRPIGKELGGLFQEIGKMGPAFKGLWNILKPILAVLGGAIAIIVKLVLNVLAKTIRPALALIGDVIGAIVRVVKGAVQIVSGFFMLFAPGHFTEGLKKMVAGIGNIFGGLIDAIWSIIKNGAKIIFGVFWGIVDGIIDAAKWLWDEMVGHSIIPDLINGIIFWFKKLISLVQWVWNNVVTPLFNVFRKLLSGVLALVRLWWTGITTAWSILKTLGTWFWDNVLKPVWNFVWGLWNTYVRPALAAWWEGVKIAWAGLKNAGSWMWENVLKPVWTWFRDLWSQRVGPALRDWWNRIKNAWSALKSAGRWIWDNVLGPVWNKVKDVWAKVGPELRAWWGRIVGIWNTLKTLGTWVWNNVLSPVLTKVKDLWTNAKTSLSGWFGGIKTVWDSLKGLGKWVYDNVMSPVYNKITGVWGSIKTWLTNNKDMLTSPVKGIVNVVIDAVNAIIKGLNKVADILPGVDWEIDLITRLAQGGPVPTRRVGSGFKTNGARAIVGEGKANHPEFVIPTDPTHRRRARSLLLMAGSKLGMFPGGDIGTLKNSNQEVQGLPAFGIGGWIGDKWGDVKDMGEKLADELKKLGKNAIGKIMNPLLSAGENKIDDLWTPARVPPQYGINQIRAWVKDSDADLGKYVSSAKSGGPKVERALKFARGMDSTPYLMGGFGPGGIDCSGFMSAIANVYNGKPAFGSRAGATSNFPWPGWKAGVDTSGFTVGSISNYGGTGVGHMAGTLGGVNVESRGGQGVVIGPSARGYNDSGFNEIYHLAQGAIVRANHGRGVLARIGEGRYDEAVTPLPRGWRSDLIGGSGDGEKHYHFYGDMSFPNVKSGDDAKTFLDNLENLAED
jgi:TP901 family phage tail tape measure protein